MSNEDRTPLVPEVVDGHGNTVAAWTLVIVVTVGLIVATVAFDTFHTVGMVVGGVIMALGIIASLVLKGMGFGKGGSRTTSHSAH
ncbi:HGxxPAAW family protein [Rothia halotolerans]|uniref:HGxxPAAW family protein n=1 Tax=Rothia halotolerans TaxID=405770 RepID=UPI00101D2E81|nr:HGxxPAAW family protein [Rothia halotolerans]